MLSYIKAKRLKVWEIFGMYSTQLVHCRHSAVLEAFYNTPVPLQLQALAELRKTSVYTHVPRAFY